MTLIERAREAGVPVVRDDTLKALVALVAARAPRRILEIGTGVGCSGIAMLQASPKSNLVTVEKDSERYAEALKNFREAGLRRRAAVVRADAEDALKALGGTFDFIFLDGAKSKYAKYLNRLDELLERGGVIFADNVGYLGLVAGDGNPPHKHRTIVNGLRKYLEVMKNRSDYTFEQFDVEDGYCVSVKL